MCHLEPLEGGQRMTYDKIKHYVGNDIVHHWSWVAGLVDGKERITKARNQLQLEINQGILIGIKYNAELKLLNYLLQ